MIITVTGASASGKTTIVNRLIESNEKPKLNVLVSHTTRPMRPGEVNGVDYFFVSKDEFDKVDFVEKAEYAKEWYGTSRDEVTRKNALPGAVITVVDANGQRALKDIYGSDVVSIFVRVNEDTLERRLRERDGHVRAAWRIMNMTRTKDHIPVIKDYDVIVDNDECIDYAVIKTAEYINAKIEERANKDGRE